MTRGAHLIVPFLCCLAGCNEENDGSGFMPGGQEGSLTGTGTGEASNADDDTGELLDVGDGNSGGGPGDCSDNGSSHDFSYIWIANSAEGTVSKIDTRTREEVGRYAVSDAPSLDPKAGPSRTSVNQEGDVAVTDRDGGIVKVLADTATCNPMQNGQAGLQTSTGPDDVFPFGEDDCVVWRTILPRNARPAAWARSVAATGGCTGDNSVWTAAPLGDGAARVYLLDGRTGELIEDLDISAADCNCPMYGPYGGAVDGASNLWTFPRDASGGSPTDGNGPLIRVDRETITYETFEKPAGVYAYGIMVDSEGRPWIAGDYNSLARFDPLTSEWTVVDLSTALPVTDYVLRGLMQDATGDIWIATMNWWETDPLDPAHPPGLLRVRAATAEVVDYLDRTALEGLVQPAGVSIDIDGFVWLVDTLGNQAFKVDPHNYAFQVVGGLNNPYTYSDMTGFGLINAGPPPVE